jgi:hypothetical protein
MASTTCGTVMSAAGRTSRKRPVRPDRAKHARRDTDDGIGEIATRCGIKPLEICARVFKRHLGAASSAIRRGVSGRQRRDRSQVPTQPHLVRGPSRAVRRMPVNKRTF